MSNGMPLRAPSLVENNCFGVSGGIALWHGWEAENVHVSFNVVFSLLAKWFLLACQLCRARNAFIIDHSPTAGAQEVQHVSSIVDCQLLCSFDGGGEERQPH